MPTNKNALIRYMILDKLLSDRNNRYTCLDLLKKVNEGLEDAGFSTVGGDGDFDQRIKNGKRVIQKDLIDLQNSPFNMEIDDSDTKFGAPVYCYADKTKTLFSQKLTDEEKSLLREVFNTLGQFSGLNNFEWMEDLQAKLNDSDSFGDGNPSNSANAPRNKAIVFSSNPFLKNSNLLGLLFNYVTHKQIIEITYQPFGKEIRKYPVAPYQLRQYNNRWFIVCTFINTEEHHYKSGFYLTLPIDRIQEIKPLPKPAKSPKGTYEYIDCADDLDEYFDDCIGITRYEDQEPQDIILAIKNGFIGYVETKPLHPSQTYLKKEQESLHSKYPALEGYSFYKIQVIPNIELISLIRSFGSDIILVSPKEVRNYINDDVKESLRLFNDINTKNNNNQ